MITFVLLISVLSGNGFHSIPAILLINGTARLPYHGPKDLNSPVYFYHRSISCDLDPIILLEIDQSNSEDIRAPVFESAEELITKEPYLVFAALFIFLRKIVCFVPAIYSCMKASSVRHTWHLNLWFLRELSQLWSRHCI